MKATEALNALAQAYRNDWSDFDGRAARNQLHELAAIYEAEHRGEDVTEMVASYIEFNGPDA